MTEHPAFLLLEDGTWFGGTTPYPAEAAFGEVVFTTSMTGYQETLAMKNQGLTNTDTVTDTLFSIYSGGKR